MRHLCKTICAALALAAFTAAGAAEAAPAYVVVNANEKDAAGYQAYAAKAAPLIEAAGGHFIVRAGKTVVLGGPAPKRVAIYYFDSMEKAQALFASDAYKALIPMRKKSAPHWQAFIVEGLPQ